MWAFKIAWKIDSFMICLWLFISIGLSVLPAISLFFNKNIINALNNFINFGSGTYEKVIPQIIIFGVILTLIGFTSRLSGDFIYMMMYNSYYVGMQQILMESIQEVDMIDLMNGKLNDEYSFAVGRAGSLTDFVSGFCSLAGKIVSIVSLLAIAVTTSKIIYIFAMIYIIGIIAFYLLFADKIRFDAQKIFGDARKADYFASLPRDVNIAKEIRIYENTEEIVKQWDKANQIVEKNELKRKGTVELHNFVGEISFYIFIMLTVAYMIVILAQGKLNITTFLVIYTLAFNIQKAISGLSKEMYNCDYGLFALEKQQQFFMKIKKETKQNCKHIQENPTITYQLENVNFSYLDGVPVIRNINLQIKKGDVVALVGANGSGKSTLANLLLNIYKPTSGTIKLNGIDLQEYTEDEVRKKISPFLHGY